MYEEPLVSGRYRRIKDGRPVQVLSCTGTSGFDTVLVKATDGDQRSWYVRLGNFWRKYETISEGS